MMLRALITTVVLFSAWVYAPVASADDYEASLPTGGYYRSMLVLPVVVDVKTYGNPVRFKIAAEGPSASYSVIYENFSVGTRETRRAVLPVIVDPANPGLYISLSNELATTRDKIWEKDLAPVIRQLYEGDRLVLCTGLPLKELSALPLSITGINLKFHSTTPDSGVFDSWRYLETVDLLVIANPASPQWTPERLKTVAEWVEQGGVLVLPAQRSAVLEHLFPMLAGWAGTGLPPEGNFSRTGEVSQAASAPYGLGRAFLPLSIEGASLDSAGFWDSMKESWDFPIAPSSMLFSGKETRELDQPVHELFSPIEIPPSTARDLLVVSILILVAFGFGIALLYSIGLGGKLWAILLLFAIIGSGLSYGIHNMIKRPGVFWRYRLLVETDEAGRGRGALFCSLSSSSEMFTAMVQPEYAQVKVLDTARPVVFAGHPSAPYSVRGIYMRLRKPTLLLVRFPVSSVGLDRIALLREGVYKMSGDVSSPDGEVFLRRFLSSDDTQVCLGLQCYERSDFEALAEPAQGFDRDEWAFLTLACERCRTTNAVANLFWPTDEKGVLRTDEISTVNWEELSNAAAVLHITPASALRDLPHDEE